MHIVGAVSCALAIISIATNIYLVFRLKRQKQRPIETYDTKQLLHDLTASGSAFIEVRRLDPNSFLLRRPVV